MNTIERIETMQEVIDKQKEIIDISNSIIEKQKEMIDKQADALRRARVIIDGLKKFDPSEDEES